jgi:hypothetical protein
MIYKTLLKQADPPIDLATKWEDVSGIVLFQFSLARVELA